MAHTPGALLERREIRHFHLFCGLGGGARGFNRGTARVGNMVADFRSIGGIDVDPSGIRVRSCLPPARTTAAGPPPVAGCPWRPTGW